MDGIERDRRPIAVAPLPDEDAQVRSACLPSSRIAGPPLRMTSCTRRSSVLADVGRAVLAGAAGGVGMNAFQGAGRDAHLRE
jgi:hypothetical protein